MERDPQTRMRDDQGIGKLSFIMEQFDPRDDCDCKSLRRIRVLSIVSGILVQSYILGSPAYTIPFIRPRVRHGFALRYSIHSVTSTLLDEFALPLCVVSM